MHTQLLLLAVCLDYVSSTTAREEVTEEGGGVIGGKAKTDPPYLTSVGQF